MDIRKAEETIRKYKDDPLTDPKKECEYNDAINSILDAIEDGYFLVTKEG